MYEHSSPRDRVIRAGIDRATTAICHTERVRRIVPKRRSPAESIGGRIQLRSCVPEPNIDGQLVCYLARRVLLVTLELRLGRRSRPRFVNGDVRPMTCSRPAVDETMCDKDDLSARHETNIGCRPRPTASTRPFAGLAVAAAASCTSRVRNWRRLCP